MQETQVLSLGQGRSPGEENGNPLQYAYLGNPIDLVGYIYGLARVRHT